ncbi:hypothetical protein JYU12_00005, partial [bacterium AH-315-K03]|nr:hypothetical protein [bacterium AH-315-K03]
RFYYWKYKSMLDQCSVVDPVVAKGSWQLAHAVSVAKNTAFLASMFERFSASCAAAVFFATRCVRATNP